MVVLDYVEVDTDNSRICLIEGTSRNCTRVSIGCPATPTQKGVFKVSTIYTHPIPQHPITGRLFTASKLGRYVITLEDTTIAIHGWEKQADIGVSCSLGCIRIPQEKLEALIFDYLFQTVIIK